MHMIVKSAFEQLPSSLQFFLVTPYFAFTVQYSVNHRRNLSQGKHEMIYDEKIIFR